MHAVAVLVTLPLNPAAHCQYQIIVRDSRILSDKVLSQLNVYPVDSSDNVIDEDLILVCGMDDRRAE